MLAFLIFSFLNLGAITLLLRKQIPLKKLETEKKTFCSSDKN